VQGTYGRIRTLQQGTDGALFVTTDNGGEADQLLRVTPR
jgi:glucose/arabinose dehydrogenase